MRLRSFRASTTNVLAASFLLAQSLTLQSALADPTTSDPSTSVPVNSPGSSGNSAASGTAAATTLSQLMVGSGQNLVLDFGNSSSINVTDNIHIEQGGTLYAISTNPNVTNASLFANNIFNNLGGTITSILPTGGLAGYANAIPNLSLSLIAVNDIINAGTISSAANLNMFAGGQILNQATQGAVAPVMQAVNNLNLFSSNIINQGMIESLTANININNPATYTATLANVMGVNDLSSLIANTVNVTGPQSTEASISVAPDLPIKL